MVNTINYAGLQLSGIYTTTSQQLAASLTRIASGKKFQNSSEDLIGFLRSQRLASDISGYEDVRENLTKYKVYTSSAVATASNIYDSLTRMKELSIQYDATSDADLQAEYTAEFNALKTEVSTAIGSTYVDGKKTVDVATLNAIADAYLDPDGNGKLAFNFTATMTETADVTALAIATAGGTDIQTEITNVRTFLEEAKGYDAIIDHQLAINETVINSKEAVKSLITDIDEAEEMNSLLDLQIRQQAVMSMLSQANISREAVLKLYR